MVSSSRHRPLLAGVAVCVPAGNTVAVCDAPAAGTSLPEVRPLKNRLRQNQLLARTHILNCPADDLSSIPPYL